MGGDLEDVAVADDRLSTLALFERDIHPPCPKSPECCLHAVLADDLLDVAVFALSEPQQGAVGTTRVLEDAPFDQSKKVRLTLGDLA